MARSWSSARLVAGLALLVGASPRAWAAFEDLGAGARGPGMGDAFVAVADDLYSVYYNPAGLGTLTRPQFGASYNQLHMGLSDGSNLGSSFLGYAHPLDEGRRGTLATAWNSFSLDTSLYRDDAFYLSYGRLWLSDPERGEVFVGGSLKYLRSSFGSFRDADNATNGIQRTGKADPVLAGSHSRGAVDTDVGLLARFMKHYALGLELTHLNQPNVAFSPADKDRLPVGVKLGLNYMSLISNLVAQVDSRQGPGGSRDNNLTIGAERWFPRLLSCDFGGRGAFSVGSREFKQLSLGLSLRTRRFVVDYGFALPIQTVASTAGSHRLAVTFRFGRATDQEETLEMLLEAMRDLKTLAHASPAASMQAMTPAQKALYEEYIAQSRLLLNQARYKDALGKLSEALTLAPADQGLLERFGRLNLVSQHFESLTGYKDSPVEWFLHQGAMAYLGGNNLEAMDKVSNALALQPKDKRVESFVAQLELVTGIQRLTSLKRTPKSMILDTTMIQAKSALEDKRYAEAVELSLSVLREDDTVAEAWQNLGAAYLALRDYESSLRAWDKAYALEKSPGVREAIRGYMQSISRLKQKEASRRAEVARPLPEKPKLSSQEVQALLDSGVDHFARREFEQAALAFERILGAYPEHEEARKALNRVKEELR